MLDPLSNISWIHTLLALGALWVPLLVLRLFRSPLYGASALLLLTIIDVWVISEMPSVHLGVDIYPHDFIFMGLFFLGLSRVLFISGVLAVPLAWYLFGSLIFISLMLGLIHHGASAGVEFRGYFYYFTVTLYFLSFPYRESDIRSISNVWLAASAVLIGITLLGWTGELIGLDIIRTGADNGRFRVLNAAQTLVVGMGLVILIHRVAYGLQNVSRPVVALFAVAVVGLQHRTVWVATTVAVLSLLSMQGSRRARLIGNFAVIGILGAVCLLPLLLFGMLDGLIASVAESTHRATDLTADTFGWRVEGWVLLLNSWVDWDIVSKLTGEPFGSGWESGREVSPHNYYIETLLRTGLLGLAAFLATFGFTLVQLHRAVSRESDGRYHALLLAMLVTQLMYYIPYGAHPEHGIILGIAISLARFGSVPESSREAGASPGLSAAHNESRIPHIERAHVGSTLRTVA